MNRRTDRHRVWDLPTRSFHWLFAGSFALAFATEGDSRYLDIHLFAGYLFAALLLFRLLWGFIGTRHALFRDFTFPFGQAVAYVRRLGRGRAARHLGHNPAGAWAIFLLLALGAATALSGLTVLGGQEGFGPLASLVSRDTGALLLPVHEILAWTLLAVVAVHVSGVVAESLLHRENLLVSMITGFKKGAGQSVAGFRLTGLSLPLAAVVLAAVSFKGYLSADADHPYRPFRSAALPMASVWATECGDCHLPYHPSLLPVRSWQAMLSQSGDHFGEDLFLDAATRVELMGFAERNAAEAGLSEAAWYIARTTAVAEAPLRITETPYWQDRHRRIPDRVWSIARTGKGANCEACHADARDGTFEDGAMRLPPVPKAPDVPKMASLVTH